MDDINSTSDDRTQNNAVRHKYRTLSDAEKAQMAALKDKGAELLGLIEELRTPIEDIQTENGEMAVGSFDRELEIATERVEEAVMWAVKHVTK